MGEILLFEDRGGSFISGCEEQRTTSSFVLRTRRAKNHLHLRSSDLVERIIFSFIHRTRGTKNPPTHFRFSDAENDEFPPPRASERRLGRRSLSASL